MKSRIFLLLIFVSTAVMPRQDAPFPGVYWRFEKSIPEFQNKQVFGISSIFQDRQGFLWLGTHMGLARHDGTDFVFFLGRVVGDADAPPVTVYPAVEGSRGDIWIGTHGSGLLRFDRGKESFVQYRHEPHNLSSLGDDTVLAVQEDRRGNLWIGTRFGGLDRFDVANRSFRHLDLGADTGAIWDLCMDGQGQIWIGTQKAGLFRLDPETEKRVRFAHDPGDAGSLGSNAVWSIFADSEGTIWVGTSRGGLNRFLPDNGRFARFFGDRDHARDLVSCTITAVAEDAAGRLWIGTSWSGLRILDWRRGEYVIYRHDPQDADSISSDNITSIFRDATGIMWIGTTDGGVNKCQNDRVKFIHHKRNPHDPASISASDVLSLYAGRSGVLWVGTGQGLDRCDERSRTVRHFAVVQQDSAGVNPGRILAINEDKVGRAWLGTENGGLIGLDAMTGKSVRYRNVAGDRGSLSNDRVYVICPEKRDPAIFWIGTHHGLSRFDSRAGRFRRFLHHPADPASLSNDVVRALYEDDDGGLWVGTLWGLNRMDRSTGKFRRWITRETSAPAAGPGDNAVNALCGDRTGRLWLGTNAGICRFDPGREEWKCYGRADGLAGDRVAAIQADGSGHLWVSTDQGLSRFDPETEAFANYGTADGLQGSRFNPGASCRAPDGRMFFGGVNGYNSFHPEKVRGDATIPPLAWTAFYRENQKVMPDPSPERPRSLTLSYPVGFVTFEFAALCYANPKMNQYAYRLEGRDREWIHLGPNHAVSVSRLNPGAYTLRVKGANPDGTWNEAGLEMRILVRAPFWRTAWFAGIAAMAAFAAAALLLRARRRFKAAVQFHEENLAGICKRYSLSPREGEILRLVLGGASNRQIEEKLFISASTVRNHVYNIYQKLGVRSRVQLINRVREKSSKRP